MSDHRAIAAVTATIKYLLQEWLVHDIDSTAVSVTPTRPDTSTSSTTPTLSLFLYHVSPNPFTRNADLPTRRADGSMASRPSLALDLHYLLTAYGGETSWHPQIILGSALRALHSFPVLTRDLVSTAITAEIGTTSGHPLESADLARQVELVRLSPLSLNLEELTKLWSVMLQTPYAISAAWQASVVFIDATSVPSPPLPVRTVQLFALPKPLIQLDTVESSVGRYEPIGPTSTLVLRGRGLKGESTWVRILGEDYEPSAVSPREISFDLSTVGASTLRAGVMGISVVHHPTTEDGDVLEYGFESNALGIVLRPTITVPEEVTLGDTLSITVSPHVAFHQRIMLYLYGDESYAIELTVDTADDVDTLDDEITVTTLRVDLSAYGVAVGTYLVRLQVDGAQSVLETSGTGAFNGPALDVLAATP